MTTTWAQALDVFEQNLRQAKKQLEGHEPKPMRPWPPEDLVDEVFPRNLEARGRLLHEESEQIQGQLTELRDSLPVATKSRRRTRHPRTRPASHRVIRDL